MKKIIVTLIVLAGIGGLGYGALQLFKANTKKYSPETVSKFSKNGAEVSVSYCQPSKKGRVIFGELVPYNEVWRTGANEATVFKTTKPIQFGSETLEAGSYSIFTIPTPTDWTVIFNQETGQWGTQYNEKDDVLRVKASTEPTSETREILEIFFDESNPQLVLTWDSTKVTLPFQVQ